MGEILPDGTIQGYQNYCKNCGTVMNVNAQGDERTPHHYCQHEKLKKVQDESQSIGDFLSWLNDHKKIVLGSYYRDGDCLNTDLEELRPIMKKHETLLAEYFGIDLDKLEEEKRAILKSIRK